MRESGSLEGGSQARSIREDEGLARAGENTAVQEEDIKQGSSNLVHNRQTGYFTDQWQSQTPRGEK